MNASSLALLEEAGELSMRGRASDVLRLSALRAADARN
ncbi:MAG: hypothetical protein RLZZ450_3298, partial [Pseudomonadota bacterium]